MALLVKNGVRFSVRDKNHLSAFLNNGWVVDNSAQEAEEAARRITETQWTATLNLYSTATDDLNSIKSELNSATYSVQIISAYCKKTTFQLLNN